MSEHAVPRESIGPIAAPRLLDRAWRFLADESLLVLCTSIFAIAFVLRLAGQVNQDAWLALAGGRLVVYGGLPHHETWTIWGAGKDFVDQQWLGQSVLYLVHAVGGLGLLAGFHAVLTLAAIVLALVVARRRGASQRSVLLLLPLGFFCLIGSTWQVRTQSLAYLPFVACLWLLAEDARRPSGRVFWCLPLLAVWGNLHGSAALGAGLVVLRGLDRASRGSRASGVALAVLAPAMLFVSPYGGSLAGYYHSTLFNSAFGSMLNEWQPPSWGLMTAPFFLLAIAVAWIAGRSRTALTRFERLALLATLLAGLSATRNIGWFAFAAIMLCPSAIEEFAPDRSALHRARSRANALAAAVTLSALVALLAATFARPASWFTEPYPQAAADAVARAADRDPGARIWSDVRFADWLLWRKPGLAGRIAFDARFEVLSRLRIAEIYNFNNVFGSSWRPATQGFRIVVLDRAISSRPLDGLLREPGARLLYAGHGLAVVERRPIRP
jgi:hypothetical protein